MGTRATATIWLRVNCWNQGICVQRAFPPLCMHMIVLVRLVSLPVPELVSMINGQPADF